MRTRIRSQFGVNSTALEVVRGLDLGERLAIVTGGGSGIGAEIARALASAGAQVIIADVDAEKSAQALRDIASSGPAAKLAYDHLDLGSLESVRDFAARFRAKHRKLDILINNAGVMAPPLRRTKEGHELQFGINFLGHFLLTRLLEPALLAAGRSRVVSVSSIGHRRCGVDLDDPDFLTTPYDRWQAYSRSKSACALLAVNLHHRLADKGVTANTMNPGGSMTGLHRFLTEEEQRELGFIDSQGRVNERWRSPAHCAATSVWLATASEIEGLGGRYFENCAEAEEWRPEAPMTGVRSHALSPEIAERLCELAERMTA